MAEIAVSLLGPIIELGKCIVAPIKRQFIYVCCFYSNVQILDKEANKLEDVRDDVQRDVETAENNAELVKVQVKRWLEEVKDIQQEKSKLDTKITNVRGGDCVSVITRYSTSRRVFKTAAAMKQKWEEDPRASISIISYRPPPVSMLPDIPEKLTSEFASRKKIEQDLMALLKDEKVMMLGICGMGGVGKTTLARKIKNRVMKEKVFDESLMAVVSQPANKKKIQEDIAGELGLKFDDHEKSISSRASRLCTRLRCTKRIFIVLDDVWEYLDLEELGIRCESGCTILFTSRNRDALARMDAQPILEMETLAEEEALSFFKEKLGTCADDQNQISSLAEEIAKECKGLPLALTIVARVLKGQIDSDVWKDALGELRHSNPEDLQDVLKEVYTPLKLSYDYLSTNAKFIFLLCSLFPEDFDIPLWELTTYAMGLRMFKGIGDLESVRIKTYSLAKTLKRRFLLLEGRDEEHVRMHDIVRDVAIFIASEAPKDKPLIKCGYNSTWISPFVGGERIELSKGSTFPNLRLLLIDKSADEELQISDKGMKELNVLSIRSNSSLTSLQLTTQNLGTLILENCKSLKTISVVGELLNLEILICRECNAIEEFPYETLKFLRLLEISNCRALKKIGPARGISCLDNDDDHSLHLLGKQKVSFVRKPPRVEEIENCEKIFCCQIPIGSSFTRLQKLRIEDCDKIKSLFSFSIAQNLESLKVLKIVNCIRMAKVIEMECSHDDTTLVFPHLQELSLHDLPSLKTYCNSALGFPKLLKLEIYQCHEIGGFNLTTPNLVSLESLRIEHCSMMQQVFLWSEEEENEIIRQSNPKPCHVTFPKLRTLKLFYLRGLINIYRGVESIGFPLLTRVSIDNCPNLKSGHVSANTCSSSGDININKVLFGNFLRKVRVEVIRRNGCQILIGTFTRLEELTIEDCRNIMTLFSFSTAHNLESLKHLTIKRCHKMVNVIEEVDEECSRDTTLVFPNLEELRFRDLPKLKTFCNSALVLPKLLKLEILSCVEIGGFLTTPNLESLESLEIYNCSLMEQVFSWSEIIGQGNPKPCHGTFPKLTTLKLLVLPGLTNFYKGVESIEFPLLTRMSIVNCPNQKSLVSDIRNKVVGETLKEQSVHYSSLSILDQIPIGSFSRLEDLWISGYNEISSLLSSSVAAALINLKNLHIGECKNMVKVIEGEGEEYSNDQTTFVFPHLEWLRLDGLPKLKTFCEWRCALELPSLETMSIDVGCRKMERFSLGSLTTPNLKTIRIEFEKITVIAGDLNDVLQKRFSNS